MFNLTVDTAHTFYVGANGWLVHNGCRLYPNKIHPVTGVHFDAVGYPIFDSVFDATIPVHLVGPTITDYKQFKNATEQLDNWIKADPSRKALVDSSC